MVDVGICPNTQEFLIALDVIGNNKNLKNKYNNKF